MWNISKPTILRCDICGEETVLPGIKGSVKINREGIPYDKTIRICKKCHETNHKVSNCACCQKYFDNYKEVSYVQEDNTLVCNNCDKRLANCCVCQSKNFFKDCARQNIDGETKFRCLSCHNDESKEFCRNCWKHSDGKHIYHRYLTDGPYCSECYNDLLLTCTIRC